MTEGKMETCPICKLNDNLIVIEPVHPIGERIECPRCKNFSILDRAAFTTPNLKFGTKLSAWIRERNEHGAEAPQITTGLLEDRQKDLYDRSPREKQIKLLQNIERKTEYPGKLVKIDPEFDIPLAWASAKEEFMHYINSLIERGLLRNLGKEGIPYHQGATGELIYDRPLAFSVAITADGWDYLEQRELHIEERTQAFVAMSFLEEFKPIYEGPIRQAITNAGYKARRVDDEPHIDRIDMKIISEIKNSRFLVAEVTEQNPGVYFEAGYAYGLGLPVIWCVKEDKLKEVHFDTRQYNHIDWKSESDLETRLYDFICAIIGKRKQAVT